MLISGTHRFVVDLLHLVALFLSCCAALPEATLNKSDGALQQRFALPHLVLKDSKALIPKENATFYVLCRNSDLFEILETIQNVEDRFNHRYHYDWVFLNDKPFTQTFISRISNVVSGDSHFDLIPLEFWSYPDHVDQDFAAQMRSHLQDQGVKYGGSESYRHMCRFQSGFFFDTNLMKNYKYYWRIEPGVKFRCDIDYDIFRFMRENEKDFGFVLSIFEYRDTITGLWDFVKEWLLNGNIEKIHPSALLDFIIGTPNCEPTMEDLGETISKSEYNLCHFWNNFEIANMDFFRSPTYRSFFDYIDSTGGFFYSRYGDAVIHSIAVSLFMDREKVHWFNDIGYYHAPYQSCPLDDSIYLARKCTCNQIFDFNFDDYSCTGFYLGLMGRHNDINAFQQKQLEFGEDFFLRKYEAFIQHLED